MLEHFYVTSGGEETPLPKDFVFTKYDSDVVLSFRMKYQQLVGSLIYLMIGSRPDIVFTMVKLLQYMASLSKVHYSTGLHLLHYLHSTKNYKLEYDRCSNFGIIVFFDSDWASDPNDCHSITGNFVTLAATSISQLSCWQKTIALSLTEAEYMALSDCSRQLV